MASVRVIFSAGSASLADMQRLEDAIIGALGASRGITFDASTGTLTFTAEGDTAFSFDFRALIDGVREAPEQFTLSLELPIV